MSPFPPGKSSSPGLSLCLDEVAKNASERRATRHDAGVVLGPAFQSALLVHLAGVGPPLPHLRLRGVEQQITPLVFLALRRWPCVEDPHDHGFLRPRSGVVQRGEDGMATFRILRLRLIEEAAAVDPSGLVARAWSRSSTRRGSPQAAMDSVLRFTHRRMVDASDGASARRLVSKANSRNAVRTSIGAKRLGGERSNGTAPLQVSAVAAQQASVYDVFQLVLQGPWAST